MVKYHVHQVQFIIFSLFIFSPAASQVKDVQPLDAVDVVLNAFDDNDIVALSEMHAMKEEHDFIQTLLRDKSFPEKVNVVVMEGANHLYQDILDKYILHDDISLSDVRVVWRNSSQSPNVVWDAEVFEQIYITIHDINKNLPLEERVRVVGGGVPIDWSKIEIPEDMDKYRMSRDAFYAQVVQNEVLDKEKTALLIIGGMHILKVGKAHRAGLSVTQRLEESRPGSVFVVWPHTGLLGADTNRQYLSGKEPVKQGSDTVTIRSLEKELASWPVPSIALVRDTWLGNLKLSLFLPGGFSFDGDYISSAGSSRQLTLSDGIDAYLYVGLTKSLTVSAVSPATVNDETYLEELNRRSLIRFGVPFDRRLFITKPVKYFPDSE